MLLCGMQAGMEKLGPIFPLPSRRWGRKCFEGRYEGSFTQMG